MPAPKSNQYAAKSPALKRLGTAIYIRPTESERAEILQALGGQKITKFALDAILEKARTINKPLF